MNSSNRKRRQKQDVPVSNSSTSSHSSLAQDHFEDALDSTALALGAGREDERELEEELLDDGMTSPPDITDSEQDDDFDASPAHMSNAMRRMLENEDDEGEDLFSENMNKDYKEMPHLDRYDSSNLDEQDYAPLPRHVRQEVDAALNARDQELLRRQGRIPEIFLPDPREGIGLLPSHMFTSKRAARQLAVHEAALMDDGMLPSDFLAEEDMMMSPEALIEAEASGFSLREFLSLEQSRRRISRDYQHFLTTYVDEQGHSVYNAKIRSLCGENKESLEVSYEHIAASNSFLARLLANFPRETLAIFGEATMKVILEQFPEYKGIQSEVHVRITDLPTLDQLRDLRYTHLNTLVRVNGVVTRRTGVFPQLKLVKMDCIKCGHVLGPFVQDLQEEIKIGSCSECQSKGPFSVNDSQTVYRNYQKMTLQETPGSVPAGRLPRHKEIVLLWDLIDCARPGEEVEVTGIYMNNFSYALNTKNGFPVFATLIEANYISKKQDQFMAFRLTEEDHRAIRQLATDPNLERRILKSIAPSIYGHEDIKLALALSMFAGQPKSLQGGRVQLRGDINVLLLGDPGTAKSQFLKYVEKTSPRAIYTTGQGASAVGLTASVRKDPVTREWTLEGGALVLADKGICLIDEFDKMNDADRTSIHEAMEQQSISISKAGIVTSLQARCAVIAAANPLRGRYNPSISFSQNVELSDPILSRFDILCVVRDVVDPIIDGLLARFVVSSHQKSHPLHQQAASTTHLKASNGSLPMSSISVSDDISLIDQTLLKKYILYAKSKVFPTLRQLDIEKLSRLYADMRQESIRQGGLPITVRHIESMVRMSEAHARMHLRDIVRVDDMDVAIRVMLQSFISAQKFSVAKRLNKAFSKYLNQEKDPFQLLYYTLKDLIREKMAFYRYKYLANPAHMPKVIEIDMDDLESRAKELHVYDVSPFLQSKLFLSNGFRVNMTKRAIEYDHAPSD